MRQVVEFGRLLELKNNGKSLNFEAQKWSWSLTRGGRLLEVPTVRPALTGKVLVPEFWIGGLLWKVVPYERWSHMEVRLYHQLT